MIDAIKSLADWKAQDSNKITAELPKKGGTSLVNKLHELFTKIWKTGQMPQTCKDAILIYLYKNKGKAEDPGNYGGVALLSIPGKVLAGILLRRIVDCTKEHLQDWQYGFRKKRSTVEAQLALLETLRKRKSLKKNTYAAFIDLEKAFDKVPGDRIVNEMLPEMGVTPHLCNLIEQLYQDNCIKVRIGNELGKNIPRTQGVRQGSKEGPLLFNL